MRRTFKCVPYFYPETDSTIVVVTTPTEEPNPEPTPQPTPEDNKHLEIGTELGVLKAKVETLEQTIAEQTSKIEMLQAEDRWTEDRIRSLWEEMFRMQEQVTEALEEHREEVAEEVVEGIPAIPPQVAPQGEPESEAKTKKRPWFL